MAKKKKVLGAINKTLGLIKKQETFVLEELGHLESMQDLLAGAIRTLPQKNLLLENTKVHHSARKSVHKNCSRIMRDVKQASSRHYKLTNKVLKHGENLFVFFPPKHRSVLRSSLQQMQNKHHHLNQKREGFRQNLKSSPVQLESLHQQVTKVIKTGVEPLLSAVRKNKVSWEKIN